MFSGIRVAVVTVSMVSAVAFLSVTSTPLHAQLLQANAQPIQGISCDGMEGQRLHIHQHLVILDHGKPVSIPANVGQVPAKSCLYWVHTHTPDGIVHIEAPLDRKFTLGNFFAIWGQPLSRTHVATAVASKGTTVTVWVNGKKFVGDLNNIDLDAHADIVIQVGAPFTKPVPFTAWGTL